MSEIDRKIRDYRRKELFRIIRITLLSLVVISVLVLGTIGNHPISSTEIEAKILGATMVNSDTGNIVKLELKSDDHNFFVTLPKGVRLIKSGSVVVLKGKSLLGKTTYTFVKYGPQT